MDGNGSGKVRTQRKRAGKNRIIEKNGVEGRGTNGNGLRQTENVRDELLHDRP